MALDKDSDKEKEIELEVGDRDVWEKIKPIM